MPIKDRSTRVVYQYYTRQSYQNLFNQFANNFLVERTLDGENNPKWRDQVANHVSATTGMTGVRESVDSVPCGGNLTVKNVNAPGGTMTQTVSGFATENRYLPLTDFHQNPTIGTSSAQNQAMSKAFKQVRQAQISMSGGVFLGELREAAHMLRHPAKALRDHLGEYVKKLSRAKKLKPKKWLDTLSQTWLESSFGWRPFVNDLEDAMKAYQEVQKGAEAEYRSIRAVGKADGLVSQLLNDGFAPIGNFRWLGNKVVKDYAICVIRGEVKRLAVTTAADKARVFGLTPGEFLPTAWELVPWSFLVDYFTNIGDIIENSVTDTSSVAWLNLTTIRKRITTAGMRVDVEFTKTLNGINFISVDGSPGSFVYVRKLVTRNKLSQLTVPPLTFELPGTTMKELNMLALFTQANTVHAQDIHKLRGRTFR
jgi:hypothetical protein